MEVGFWGAAIAGQQGIGRTLPYTVMLSVRVPSISKIHCLQRMGQSSSFKMIPAQYTTDLSRIKAVRNQKTGRNFPENMV